MAEEAFRMMELSLQGYNCSQILARLALDAQGRDDPDLVRAMSGLLSGLGCGRVCGALTGGCCLLGLYAGKGADSETGDDRLAPMLGQLVDWFEAEFGRRYGSTDCAAIAGTDPALRLARCPELIMATFDKAREILAANGYALADRPGIAA